MDEKQYIVKYKMKKIIIIFSCIAFLVIGTFIALSGAFNNLGGINNTISSISPTPVDTYSNRSSRPLLISPTIIQTKVQSSSKEVGGEYETWIKYQKVQDTINNLSEKEKETLSAIKSNVPYKSENFEIDYSPTLGTFIVLIKNEKGEEEFLNWAKENGFSDFIKNTKTKYLFEYIEKDIGGYITTAEQKLQEEINEINSNSKQEANIDNNQIGSQNISTEIPSSIAQHEQSLENLTSFINSIVNFPTELEKEMSSLPIEEEINYPLEDLISPTPLIDPSVVSSRLDYTISFRDSSIKPKSNAKNIIANRWSSSKEEYYDIIVSKSIARGWNPAFILALWAEETHASDATKISCGGGGNGTANEHLGCRPQTCKTIEQSLDCVFNNFSSFENNQFKEFMMKYSGETSLDFINNPYFVTNIKYWYKQLADDSTTQDDKINDPSSIGSVSDLVSVLTNICGDSVNANCVNSLKSVLPQNIYNEIFSSVSTFGSLSCVNFAKAALMAESQKPISETRNSALEYITSPPNGYQFISYSPSSQIKKGDLIILDVGHDSGHMAYVMKIYNKDYIRIAEASWGGAGRVDERDYPLEPQYNGELKGWLREKI